MSKEQIITIQRHPKGPRVWVLNQRVHHGASGILTAAACVALRKNKLAAVALLAVAHDAHDWREWFIREAIPAV